MVADYASAGEHDPTRSIVQALAGVGHLLAKSLDPDAVGQRVVDSVCALLRPHHAALFRLEPASGDLVLLAVCGDAEPVHHPNQVWPRGTSLAAVALSERRPVVTPDVLTDPRVVLPPELRARIEEASIRVVLAVPLLVKDRPVGVLGIADRAGRTFGDEDIQLAQAFADLAAVALENEQLRITAERSRRETEEIAWVARRLAELHDVRAVGGQIVDSVLTLFDVVSSGLRLLQPDGSLIAIAWAGRSEGLFTPGHVLPPGMGIASRAVAEGRPVWTKDVLNDPTVVLSEQLRGLNVAGGHRAVLAVPLRVREAILGTLAMADETARAFSDSEVALAQTFADQAAVALENARLYEEAERRRRETSRQRLEAEEAERRQIARELHDEIGQILTGLKLALDMSARLPADAVRARLGEAQALVNDLIARVHDLSLDLRPAMLDDLGLLPALLWHFERYTAQTGVRVAFQHAGLEGRRFAPAIETAAYRIVQEALTNVARHARVSEVTVRLWRDQATLYAQVQDRGIGFDPERVQASRVTIGLAGMRERAVFLGGDLTLESAPGDGSRLMAELPLGESPEGKGR